METMIQPKITGYRQLNEEEAVLMNKIKEHGAALEELIKGLYATDSVDNRWITIGECNLQMGLMALTRAVARPDSF